MFAIVAEYGPLRTAARVSLMPQSVSTTPLSCRMQIVLLLTSTQALASNLDGSSVLVPLIIVHLSLAACPCPP